MLNAQITNRSLEKNTTSLLKVHFNFWNKILKILFQINWQFYGGYKSCESNKNRRSQTSK